MLGREERIDTESRNLPLKIIKSLMAALAPVLPIALIHPIQIHTANAYEFDLALTDLIIDLLLCTAVITAVLTIMLVAVPWRWHKRLVAMTLGIALAVWVQGQLLVWEYGVLDGSIPDWSGFMTAAVVDTLAWLLIAVVAVLLRRLIYGQAIAIALALIVIQAIPAIDHLRSQPEISDFHRYQFDETYKFSFSREENVIILMLDAFQTDIFQQILTQEPEIADSLDGFTYFRNALAGYSKTYPSVALMMSGQWYENDIPIQRFIKQSFEGSSLPAALGRAGWRVEFFPHIKRVVHASPTVVSNAVPRFDCATARSESGYLLDLGFFRVSPHWFKSFWLNAYEWRFSRALPVFCAISPRRNDPDSVVEPRSKLPHAALRFLENAERFANTERVEKVFKFYHLMIPHAPFKLDEELTIKNLPRGPVGFKRQSRATVEFVVRFLETLKAANAYDNTLIFIVSDHGGGEYIHQVNLDLVDGESRGGDSSNAPVPGIHLASGLPLMLVKQPGASGELQVSDAPVSLADIAATIASELDLEKDYPGENIFSLEESASRNRRYLFFEFDGWRSEFLPEMTEYEVQGFSWNANNWRKTGRIFAGRGDSTLSEIVEAPLDREFGFRPASHFARVLTHGWSEPQDNGLVWSQERTATIKVRIPDAGEPVRTAHFDMMPFLARGAISSARIRVRVNGRSFEEWNVDGRTWQSVELPAAAVDEKELEFTFEFPDADAPINYGYSLDRRLLGMALYKMRISTSEQ